MSCDGTRRDPSPLPRTPGYGPDTFLPSSYQQIGPKQLDKLQAVLARYENGQPVNLVGEIHAMARTPSVRCRTRLTWVMENLRQPPDTYTGGGGDPKFNDSTTARGAAPPTLWAASIVPTRSLARAPSPVRNLVGTRGAPLSIPTGPELWGFDLNVETFGEVIFSKFNVLNAGLNRVQWTLVAQYASVERLTAEEWQQAISNIGIFPSIEAGLTISDGSG